MPADSPLSAQRDSYCKTANELTDLIRDLEVFAQKFKSLAQTIDAGSADAARIQSDAQLVYRDLATVLELAARLGHPQ